MNQLLPIIRRVRRPLIAADAPPVMVGNVEPLEAKAESGKAESGNTGPAEAGTTNQENAETDFSAVE